MALDIGEKRVGVAISDPERSVATPVAVLDARKLAGDAVELRRLLTDYTDVELIIIGLPLTMSGERGPQAARIEALGTKIAEKTGLPVAYADERLSSVEAKRRMAEAGADSRAQRGSVDMVAASITLQAYLDAERSC